MSVYEEQLFCGICRRDYELPRRYMLFAGDHDFSPIPRLLPCLHTICHSCIEEQYEKEDAHNVCCPTCDHVEPIKSVDLLPLDFSTLKKVVASNNTELLAWCAKCYDPVSSVSWCESCSSALCEFHHQDHKLSADTSRHSVATFKEYVEQGKHIEFKFPPIACPHCPLQDSLLYCNSCLHLVSPKGFIDFHKDHRVTDYEETIPEMVTAVQDAVEISDSNHMSIGTKVREIRERLRTLDENETSSTEIITSTFDRLREALKSRESEMLFNLSSVINDNRKKLKRLMQELITLDGKIQRVTNCGSALLHDTINSDTVEKMYLVAAADSIEYRADYLNDQLTQLMSEVDSLRDPICNVRFIREDLNIIEGIVNRLGSMSTGLEEPVQLFALERTNQEDEEMKGLIGDEYYELTEDERQLAAEFDMCFTVKLRDQPPSRLSNVRGKLPRSASVTHSIIIEARLCRRDKGEWALERNPSNDDVKYKNSRGVLLGKIEVIERMDRDILAKHKIKSYFETVKQSNNTNNPLLKLMKEFVPIS